MPSTVRDIVVQVHRRSASSLTGEWCVGEHALADDEIAAIGEAVDAGYLDRIVYFDLGDYYRLSVTRSGRREFGLPAIERPSVLARLRRLLVKGRTAPSR